MEDSGGFKDGVKADPAQSDEDEGGREDSEDVGTTGDSDSEESTSNDEEEEADDEEEEAGNEDEELVNNRDKGTVHDKSETVGNNSDVIRNNGGIPTKDDGETVSGVANEDRDAKVTFANNAANNNTVENVSDGDADKKATDNFNVDENIIKSTLICSVCLGDNSNDANEIIECDGCGVTVHEGCYGVQENISLSSTTSSCSTEPWFCESCRAGVINPTCELCPAEGGIFKETNVGQWVHLVCALYVPHVKFGDQDGLSNITLFDIPPAKWGDKPCEFCEHYQMMNTGITIRCDSGLCNAYFHVTCGQREGLLANTLPCEEYAAYCKFHTNQDVARSKKRNWLALEYRTKMIKKKLEEGRVENTATYCRNQRKLALYKVHYAELKANRPAPLIPTQKMPRLLTTNPRACRELARKTEMVGICSSGYNDIDDMVDDLKDLSKKWNIQPNFSCEFVGYFYDRDHRSKKLKTQIAQFKEERKMLANDKSTKEIHDSIQTERADLLETHASLMKTVHMYHNVLSKVKPDLKLLHVDSLGCSTSSAATAAVPAAVSVPSGPSTSIQPRPSTSGAQFRPSTSKARSRPSSSAVRARPSTSVKSGKSGHMISSLGHPRRYSTSCQLAGPSSVLSAVQFPKLTAAALKEGVGYPVTLRDGSISACTAVAAISDTPSVVIEKCATCNESTDAHLLVKCDTCQQYYHLACLSPPLTKMPKKTKQMGWQCSECDNTINTLEVEPVDTNAPRTLRHFSGDRKCIKSSTSSENSFNDIEDDLEDEDIPKRHSSKKKPRGYKRRRKSASTTDEQTEQVPTASPEPPRQGIKLFIKSVPNKNGSANCFISAPMSTTSTFVAKTEEYVTSATDSPSSPKQKTTKVIENKCEQCDSCNNIGTNLNMVKCDECSKCFHFGCLDPPVKKSPKVRGYSWHCADCDNTESDSGNKPPVV